MKTKTTEIELRNILRKACEKAGSQRAWGAENNIGLSHLSDVLAGKRGITDTIANALGYSELKERMYVKID